MRASHKSTVTVSNGRCAVGLLKTGCVIFVKVNKRRKAINRHKNLHAAEHATFYRCENVLGVAANTTKDLRVLLLFVCVCTQVRVCKHIIICLQQNR